MGYDVHITRQDVWEDDAARMIGDAKWRALAEADPELRWDGMVKAKLPLGRELVYENPLLAIWVGHPDAHPVPFDFRRGKVVVKNPDNPTLDKMRQVALLLNARVQGDGGEFYDSND